MGYCRWVFILCLYVYCLAMPLSVKVTVRVPRELKKRMDMFSYVNWSEVVRKAIEEKVREEEVKLALKIMGEISAKAKPEKPLAKVIREFRDRRCRSA